VPGPEHRGADLTLGQEQRSPFGEKLSEAACIALIPGQPGGEAISEIWSEGIQVKLRGGSATFLPFTQMQRAESANFGIHLATPTGVIFLSALGANYNPFYQRLTDAWGDALARALLMNEDRVVYETRATYINVRPDGSQGFGPCRVRIQPTGLVILPAESSPVRIHFSRIVSSRAENFRVNVETSDRGVFELLRMGAAYQVFADKLVEARRDFESECFQTLVEISPGIGFDRLQELGRMMAEGRAVSRGYVMKKVYDFWITLERLINESPLAASYRHLKSLAIDDLISIGLKKTLQGDYLWFMMVIAGSIEQGGNSVVLEVTSETGHATYLFRIIDRGKFPSSTPEQLQEAASQTLGAINDAMTTTGFRREPIYLDEGRLNTDAYRKYLYAAKNLPELKLLRERFYARIIHSTPEKWASDLADALKFNVRSSDDSAKWNKSSTDAS
jgi:hypothetical protein